MPTTKKETLQVVPEKKSRFGTTPGIIAQITSTGAAVEKGLEVVDPVATPAESATIAGKTAKNALRTTKGAKASQSPAPSKIKATKVKAGAAKDDTPYTSLVRTKEPLVSVATPYLVGGEAYDSIPAVGVITFKSSISLKETIREHCFATQTNQSDWLRRAALYLLAAEQDAIRKLR